MATFAMRLKKHKVFVFPFGKFSNFLEKFVTVHKDTVAHLCATVKGVMKKIAKNTRSKF